MRSASMQEQQPKNPLRKNKASADDVATAANPFAKRDKIRNSSELRTEPATVVEVPGYGKVVMDEAQIDPFAKKDKVRESVVLEDAPPTVTRMQPDLVPTTASTTFFNASTPSKPPSRKKEVARVVPEPEQIVPAVPLENLPKGEKLTVPGYGTLEVVDPFKKREKVRHSSYDPAESSPPLMAANLYIGANGGMGRMADTPHIKKKKSQPMDTPTLNKKKSQPLDTNVKKKKSQPTVKTPEPAKRKVSEPKVDTVQVPKTKTPEPIPRQEVVADPFAKRDKIRNSIRIAKNKEEQVEAAMAQESKKTNGDTLLRQSLEYNVRKATNASVQPTIQENGTVDKKTKRAKAPKEVPLEPTEQRKREIEMELYERRQQEMEPDAFRKRDKLRNSADYDPPQPAAQVSSPLAYYAREPEEMDATAPNTTKTSDYSLPKLGSKSPKRTPQTTKNPPPPKTPPLPKSPPTTYVTPAIERVKDPFMKRDLVRNSLEDIGIARLSPQPAPSTLPRINHQRDKSLPSFAKFPHGPKSPRNRKSFEAEDGPYFGRVSVDKTIPFDEVVIPTVYKKLKETLHEDDSHERKVEATEEFYNLQKLRRDSLNSVSSSVRSPRGSMHQRRFTDPYRREEEEDEGELTPSRPPRRDLERPILTGDGLSLGELPPPPDFSTRHRREITDDSLMASESLSEVPFAHDPMPRRPLAAPPRIVPFEEMTMVDPNMIHSELQLTNKATCKCTIM